MSVLNTLPAPVIQMGLVEKLVEAEQNQPYVQQLVAQTTARQELKEARERIAAPENSEESKQIRDREARQGRREQRQSGRQGGKNPAESDEEDAPRTKPWAGHILNIKI